MMESVNELREYAECCCPANEPYDTRMMEIADEIECEIAEKYMRLPVDAYGVPIHVGDVLEIADSGIEDDGPETVKSVSSGLVWFGGTMGIMGGAFRHAKPDKLSELLERFAEAIDETAGRKANENEPLTAGEWEELVRDEAGYYAEIIRELAERGEL